MLSAISQKALNFLNQHRRQRQSGLQLAEERQLPDEERLLGLMLENAKFAIRERDGDGQYRRDAHPKAHGTVRATVQIEDRLPDHLKVGLFAEPKKYAAWIRFSSASSEIASDTKKGTLGAAIKLMGVAGAKLSADEKHSHDFVMISHPHMVVADVKGMHGLLVGINAGKKGLINYFLNPSNAHPREMLAAMLATTTHTSPLNSNYWSTTPYLLGEKQAVKYSLRPVAAAVANEPIADADSQLRLRMQHQLSEQPAQMQLMVQLQTDAEQMPIEDALIPWDEAQSPFIRVATVSIEKQQFNNPERDHFGENLAMNPWHCTAEHRPLGSLNRARGRIYQQIVQFRQQQNGETHVEPRD